MPVQRAHSKALMSARAIHSSVVVHVSLNVQAALALHAISLSVEQGGGAGKGAGVERAGDADSDGCASHPTKSNGLGSQKPWLQLPEMQSE